MAKRWTLALMAIATLELGCSSNPTATARYTYNDCVKNTTEYLVGVTYTCTPKPCASQSTQCVDVYH